MSIWEQTTTIETLNSYNKNTLQEVLDIRYTELGDNYLKGRMPVNEKVHQPYGLLHGGASAALAETLGSMAAHLCIDPKQNKAVGTDLHSHHLRGKRDGIITGIAQPLHIGNSSHLWEIKLSDEKERLVNASQLKVAIIENRDDD